MKWNNRIIVFDLETTGHDVDPCITEIGAEALIVNPHTGELEYGQPCGPGPFSSLVWSAKPIEPEVVAMNGITDEMVLAAPTWVTVGKKLVEWASCGGTYNIKNYRLAAWGNYYDVPILRKAYADAGFTEFPFSGTVIDVKTSALMWCSLSGKRTDKLSVEKMAGHLNMKPLPGGIYHRAGIDADMTARIFVKVMDDLAHGHFLDGKYYRITQRGDVREFENAAR